MGYLNVNNLGGIVQLLPSDRWQDTRLPLLFRSFAGSTPNSAFPLNSSLFAL